MELLTGPGEVLSVLVKGTTILPREIVTRNLIPKKRIKKRGGGLEFNQPLPQVPLEANPLVINNLFTNIKSDVTL